MLHFRLSRLSTLFHQEIYLALFFVYGLYIGVNLLAALPLAYPQLIALLTGIGIGYGLLRTMILLINALFNRISRVIDRDSQLTLFDRIAQEL